MATISDSAGSYRIFKGTVSFMAKSLGFVVICNNVDFVAAGTSEEASQILVEPWRRGEAVSLVHSGNCLSGRAIALDW